MKDYNNKGGNRGGFNKGGNRGGGGNFGRPSFGGGRGGDRGGDRGPVTMFKATCAECKNVAEVPFRPTGDKPVFCKDCFGGNKGSDDRGHNSDRGSFREKRFDDRRAPSAGAGVDTKKLQDQINALHIKIDKILKAMDIQGGYTAATSTFEAPGIMRAERVPTEPRVVKRKPVQKEELTEAIKKATKKDSAKTKKEAPKKVAKKVVTKASAKKKVAPKKK